MLNWLKIINNVKSSVIISTCHCFNGRKQSGTGLIIFNWSYNAGDLINYGEFER